MSQVSQNDPASNRIHRLIAQARMESNRPSLKEPSRPITPASYDERSSLDSTVNKLKKRSSKVDSIQRSVSLHSRNSATTTLAFTQSMTHSLSSSTVPTVSTSFDFADLGNKTADGTLDLQGMSLLICDVGELIGDIELMRTNEKLPALDGLLAKLCEAMEILFKSFKDGNNRKKRDVDAFGKKLCRELDKLVSKDIFTYRQRCIGCKLLIKFVSLQLAQQPSYREQLLLVEYMKNAFRALYCLASELQHSGIESFRANIANLSVSIPNPSGGISPRGSYEKKKGSAADEVLMEFGLIDSCMEYISSVWQRFTVDIMRLQEACTADGDSDDHDAGVSADVIDAGVLQLSTLEAASYAAGVLRIHSCDEVNRRRLLHGGIVRKLVEGLNACDNAATNLWSPSAANAVAATAISVGRKHSGSNDENESDVDEASDDEDDGQSAADLFFSRWKSQFLANVSQVLVQVTAILRNFSLDSSGKSELYSSNVIGILCRILKPFKRFDEVVLNCVRVTAKLSLLENFRSQINKRRSHIECLTELLRVEADKAKHCSSPPTSLRPGETNQEAVDTVAWPNQRTWPLLSRIAFTLANLTTSNDDNRILIGKSLTRIIDLLQACTKVIVEISSPTSTENSNKAKASSSSAPQSIGHDYDDMNDDEDNDGNQNSDQNMQELWDASIRLLRLYANICINERNGISAAMSSQGLQVLCDLLVCMKSSCALTTPPPPPSAAVAVQSPSPCVSTTGLRVDCAPIIAVMSEDANEELLLNIVAACTNVTFYACQPNQQQQQDDDVWMGYLVEIARQLSTCLFHDNEEIVLETSRALGNLTRFKKVLDSLCSSRTGEALLILLSHSNRDVVSAVTGVLVNMSSDPGSRQLLLQSTDICVADELVSILRKASLRDLPLSCLLCQVFHNLMLQGIDDLLTDEITGQLLVTTIEELVDCANEFASESDANREKYGQFVQVGEAVLELLSAGHIETIE